MNRNAILAAAGLSIFADNLSQSPDVYADAQMQGRGNAYVSGPFSVTKRKLVAAQAVNGVALVTLWRVVLVDAEKPDTKGFQIQVFDLAGNILDQTKLDDSAPKGKSKGFGTYGAIAAAVAQRTDLVYAAIHSARDAAQNRVDELDALLAECTPETAAEPTPETAEA
jgi:hypothetical protein